MSFRLGRQIDWAVIDHMPWGVASSTDLKVANFVRMSPLMTKITLGHQTMMCCMTQHRFPTGRTGVQGAGEPMVTEIQAMVTLGVGGVGVSILDKNSRGRGCDPLSFNDLDADDIIAHY